MLIEDVMEVANIPLEEGITFFKNSKRMKKLSAVILQKSQFIEEDDKKREIIKLVNKINRLADKFEVLEQSYKTGDKNTIKQQYRKLETEYADVVALAKKEEMKTILKTVAAYGVLVSAMIIPTLLITKLTKQFGSVNPITHDKTLNPFLKAAIYVGSSAGVRLLSPVDKIENINRDVINKSSNALMNKEILS